MKNLYCHKTSAQELKADIESAKEEENRRKILKVTKEQRMLEDGMHYKRNEVDFNIRIINFLDEFQKGQAFTFLQSVILTSAYVAGVNSESLDIALF